MTPQELKDKIREWEVEEGEAFFDYFVHDRVDNMSWAFWLLGKGFTEHALNIIDLHKKDTHGYVGQEELYEIHPEYVGRNEYGDPKWVEENYEKNVEIVAEFLLATPHYTEMVTKWFDNKEWS